MPSRAIQKILKREGALSEPTKKMLYFRFSKNVKITLEAITLWQTISISVFRFSLFLYTYIKLVFANKILLIFQKL